MSYVINKNCLVSNIDPIMAQKIVRFLQDCDGGIESCSVSEELDIGMETVDVFLRHLEKDGYVKKRKVKRKELWDCTKFGIAYLAAARIGKPMSYREAEKKIRLFGSLCGWNLTESPDRT